LIFLRFFGLPNWSFFVQKRPKTGLSSLFSTFSLYKHKFSSFIQKKIILSTLKNNFIALNIFIKIFFHFRNFFHQLIFFRQLFIINFFYLTKFLNRNSIFLFHINFFKHKNNFVIKILFNNFFINFYQFFPKSSIK
jgi:hypothetical protein